MNDAERLFLRRMVAVLVAARRRRGIVRQVFVEGLLHGLHVPVVHEPPSEVRTRQHFAVRIGMDLVAHLNPEAAEVRENAFVARLASVQDLPEERLQFRIVSINPDAEEMKPVKPLPRIDRQLDAGDKVEGRGRGGGRDQLLHAVAVVVVGERQHTESARPRLFGDLPGRKRPVARRRMTMEINDHKNQKYEV